MGRVFTHHDQERFSLLSGDCNPIHMDPVAARRMLHGRVVVHGMHLVLWALDRCLSPDEPLRISTIKTRFHAPVFLGDTVEVFHEHDGNKHSIAVSTQTGTAIMIAMTARGQPWADTLLQQPL